MLSLVLLSFVPPHPAHRHRVHFGRRPGRSAQPMSAIAINEADFGTRFASSQRTYIIAPEASASEGVGSLDGRAAVPDPAIAQPAKRRCLFFLEEAWLGRMRVAGRWHDQV